MVVVIIRISKTYFVFILFEKDCMVVSHRCTFRVRVSQSVSVGSVLRTLKSRPETPPLARTMLEKVQTDGIFGMFRLPKVRN